MKNVLGLVQSLFEAESVEDAQDLLAALNLDAFEAAVRKAGSDYATRAAGDGEDAADALATAEILGWALDQVDEYRSTLAADAEAATARAEAAATTAARFETPAAPEPIVEAPAEDVAAAAAEVAAAAEAVEAAAAAEVPPVPATTTATEVAPVAPAIPAEVAAAAEPAKVPAMEVITPPADHAPVTDAGGVKVTAGADIPMYGLGQPFPNNLEIAKAMVSRRAALGSGTRGVSGERVMVAHMNYLDQLPQASDDGQANAALMREAALAVRDGRTSLVASGGFCAPSETIYSFVKINNPTDLVQQYLPTIGAPRGSVQYPDSPDIRDAFTADPSHAYTNANDISAVAKSVTRFACPDFNTCTVEAQYEIIEWGNFGTMAYPEWVAHWMGLTTDVHAHRVSRKLINAMVTLSSAAVVVGPSGGATATVLSYLALAGADYRQDLKTGRTAPLEVLCPSFIYDMIRSDLVRSGAKTALDALAVSNATIDGWVAMYNMRLAPVGDWQNNSDVSSNSATGASVWPGQVEMLIYTPGTFVRADMGTLNLGLVRDSVLNTTNDYSIFAESFEQVCKPGIESRRYAFNTCVNGEFAALANLLCTGIGPVSS